MRLKNGGGAAVQSYPKSPRADEFIAVINFSQERFA